MTLVDMNLPRPLNMILDVIIQSGGRPILVGGCIRDHILGLSVKDFDIEVFSMESSSKLLTILQQFGIVNEVGQHFSVLKMYMDDYEFDFSLPRRDSKIGVGHKAFIVSVDPEMTFKDASYRRDFTINSMGFDIKENKFLDPYGGLVDLDSKILRHVSDAFIEDPLRVLRGVQFLARFKLSIASETKTLFSQVNISSLPSERIFEEFKKLLLKASNPSLGFQLMRKCDILDNFPELQTLIGVPQNEKWHPEGDVWDHTLLVVDEMSKLLTGHGEEDLILMLAALCHDFGKPLSTTFQERRWRSIGHSELGVFPTQCFLYRLTSQKKIINIVTLLVKEHLLPGLLYQADKTTGVSDGAIRRLCLRVPVNLLLKLAKADHFGRTTKDAINKSFVSGDWLHDRIKKLDLVDKRPIPLLKGRHLLELGVKPGPKMGDILKNAYDLQLDGELNTLDELRDWVKKNV